jgi:hypothetical protein
MFSLLQWWHQPPSCGEPDMDTDLKRLTTRLEELGIERIPHSGKTYLGHLVSVYRLMKSHGCSEELCQAGLFHSIYGTEQFQGFKLELNQRSEVTELIGERAERLAYWNCAVDRATLDRALDEVGDTYTIRDRITGDHVPLTRRDYDDLCTVHLFDWLEQAPRSRLGWDYRRSAYRRMAERLGATARTAYDEVFARESASTENS